MMPILYLLKKDTFLLKSLFSLLVILFFAINASYAQEKQIVKVQENNGKSVVQLGKNKFTITPVSNPENNGFLIVKGNFDKISLRALSGRNQRQYYFPFGRNALTASLVVYIPEVGLAGIVHSKAEDFLSAVPTANAIHGRVAWVLLESDFKVIYPGANDYVFINNLHADGINADRLLYIGLYNNSNKYVENKYFNTTSVLPIAKQTFGFAMLFEHGKRTGLWEDVQQLLVHSNIYAQKANNLLLKVGENGTATFVDNKDSILTAYVFDKDLSTPDIHPNVSLIATNDGSSFTSNRLHSPSERDRYSIFGDGSNVYYSILIPTDLEGYYKVIDENGVAYAPENSIGLLPFVTTHKNVKRTWASPHQFDKSRSKAEFEVLHFFMAAVSKNDKLVWQPVNVLGKPSENQRDDYFIHWEVVESMYLSKVNALKVLPFVLLTMAENEKWQSFFPSKYGITYVSQNVYSEDKLTIPPLSDKMETAEEALFAAEDKIKEVQTVHLQNRQQAEADYNRYLKQREALYRAENSKESRWFSDKSFVSGNTWGGFTYSKELTSRYNQTVNQSTFTRDMMLYNNYINHKLSRY